MSTRAQRVVIMGAAGRDFHDFNTYWRDHPGYEVVAFTATQIPDIAGRRYPPELSGPQYPEGIPIRDQSELRALIAEREVDVCALAHSDLSHVDVMHMGAEVNAAGADFIMLGHRHTMLKSTKPVIAVCAVRTGCGKSQTSRAVAEVLKSKGLRVAAIRHPMPYGDLSKQICQRFADFEDLERHECTIEEREEYEPHIAAGNLVFAGVDYEQTLRAAEKEADVILWDGGNNDLPFYAPDLFITVVDPHRPGHEVAFYPGETNLRMADVIVVNKMATAQPEAVETVMASIRSLNPSAVVVPCNSPVTVEDRSLIEGRRVLVVEDGPSLTHGGMTYGAGYVAAKGLRASEIVSPKAQAVGSIAETYRKYPHVEAVLPAMGYGDAQIEELERTINAVDCDAVLIGTPIDLGRVLKIDKPSTRARYSLEERDPGQLRAAIERLL